LLTSLSYEHTASLETDAIEVRAARDAGTAIMPREFT